MKVSTHLFFSVFVLIAAIGTPFFSFAQAPAENQPALREELTALEFLQGEWLVEVNARLSKNGPWEKSEAMAVIRKVVGGTVYEEQLTGTC